MTMSAQRITQPKMINGLCVEDVEDLMEDFRNDAAAGQTKWKVSTVWMGGTQSRAFVDSFRIGDEEIKRSFTINIDEPEELGGGNLYPNPQEHLMAALNACMMVGFVALCALRGITLEKLTIESEGDIDIRGFFGLDSTVPPGYERLDYRIHVKGDGTREQFAEIHRMMTLTSPNFHNLSHPVTLRPRLIVE